MAKLPKTKTKGSDGFDTVRSNDGSVAMGHPVDVTDEMLGNRRSPVSKQNKN